MIASSSALFARYTGNCYPFDNAMIDSTFRTYAPVFELGCWSIAIFVPLLQLLNGTAVSTDQFVVRALLFAFAVVAGIGMRTYHIYYKFGIRGTSPSQKTGGTSQRSSLATRVATYLEALGAQRITRLTITALLLSNSLLLAYNGYVQSPTYNEPAHLVSGISIWQFGRFDLYAVNPPLVRMVAALPVLALDYKEDWSSFHDRPGARPELQIGSDFLYANGEESLVLLTIARWACIPFSWLGATVCYLWARDLYGRAAGVMACAIWCFEPNIMAHASLITADVGATALGLAACYTFWRWLRQPTWTQTLFTGVVLGLAELAKTTLVLFYPLWPLMWIAYRWPDRHSISQHEWLRQLGMLFARLVVGLYVLNLGYLFDGSFTRLDSFHFVSDLLVGKTDTLSNTSMASKPAHNRFANSFMGGIRLPFPKDYILGIDLQQHDFEHYGRPSYLRRQWHDHGWWYYYIYGYAVKVPLGLWGLALIAVFYKLHLASNHRLHQDITPPLEQNVARATAPSLRDELTLLFPAIVILAAASFKSGFSEHFRYILPTFPFVIIWISHVANMLFPTYQRLAPE